MTLKRKRQDKSFQMDNLANETIEFIGKIILSCEKERFQTAMRNLRKLLSISKRFYTIFSKNYFWFLCATHLPHSYKASIKPFVVESYFMYTSYSCYKNSDEAFTQMYLGFKVNEKYLSGSLTPKDQERIGIFKKFLIQKYTLYLVQTKATRLENRLLRFNK